MSQQNNQPKVLVNGCSHTRANIPDNPSGAPWPTIFGERACINVINLAADGKANQQIVEETIRYLINTPDIDYVVIQLNEWKRLNLFKKNNSFTWVPGEIDTQINPDEYVKIPAEDNRDLRVFRFYGTPRQEPHEIGDTSLVQNIITVGTLVNCLSNMCTQRNIGLSIINFHALGDCVLDPVWSTIPNEHFLIHNRNRGLYNHLLWMFDTPDTFHFEHAAHKYIAELVYEHYLVGKQVLVTKKDFDMTFNNVAERIFSYS